MNIASYAKIGKGPMIKAIGLQSNYRITDYIEEKQLDPCRSGCFCCVNYTMIEYGEFLPEETLKQAQACCDRCPNRQFKTTYKPVVKYINEKNLYGYQPRLSLNALKILLTYHFFNPNSLGMIRNIRPKDIAAYVGCSVKTVFNVNTMLQEYGYISLCHGSSLHNYNIILSEYSGYFKPASEGGRGYTVFSRDFLDEIVKVRDLNQLRILLRSALEYDSRKDASSSVEVVYKDARRYLPRYCKPNVIISALSGITKLFQVTFKEGKALLKLNSTFNGTVEFEADKQENTNKIKEFFDDLDRRFRLVNESSDESQLTDQIQELTEKGFSHRLKLKNGKKVYVPFRLSGQDLHDLGMLATTYSLERVLNCIPYVHANYRSRFSVEHIGALVRSIIKNEDAQETLVLSV